VGKVLKFRSLSIKIPDEVFKEMILRIPEGERSSFIRDAILEKLVKMPRPNKILELEERLVKIETEFSKIQKKLVDIDFLTFESAKINPWHFCLDEIDRKIMDYLIHYKGATTPELAEYIKTNRWLILNRLRRMQKNSQKIVGAPVIKYYAGEKSGKKRAWWLNEDLLET
jgi:hypothetical protein